MAIAFVILGVLWTPVTIKEATDSSTGDFGNL